ncbi:unnamed protein product, partial [Didymodactylos carnosus]
VDPEDHLLDELQSNSIMDYFMFLPVEHKLVLIKKQPVSKTVQQSTTSATARDENTQIVNDEMDWNDRSTDHDDLSLLTTQKNSLQDVYDPTELFTATTSSISNVF